jgi:hypothetical protein
MEVENIMMLRTKIVAVGVTSVVALAGFAGSAHADDTTTTFAITAGSLAIAVPVSATLGTVAAGAPSTTGSLGLVTVTDTRGAVDNSWSTTASSSEFISGTYADPLLRPGAQKVAIASVGYVTGVGTATGGGTGTFTPASALGAVAWVGGSGVKTTTWNPTITLTLRSDQVAGAYTGTITHSAL